MPRKEDFHHGRRIGDPSVLRKERGARKIKLTLNNEKENIR